MSREEEESWDEYKARAESLLEAAENNKANNINNNKANNNNNNKAKNNNNIKANNKTTAKTLLKERRQEEPAENEGGDYLEEETKESAALKHENNNEEENGKEARAKTLLNERRQEEPAENEGGDYLEEMTKESAALKDENNEEEKEKEASLWTGFLSDNTLDRSEWMSNAAEEEQSRTGNKWEPEEEDYGGRQGSVGLQQGTGGEQLDQILNRNSQDGEQEGISFASSLLEDGRDSAGRGLEKEEGSENEMGDSGVVFPFLDHSPQQENRADVEFGGGDKAELEKVKLSAMNTMNTMKMLRQPLFPFLQPGGEPERRGQFWNWEGGRGRRGRTQYGRQFRGRYGDWVEAEK